MTARHRIRFTAWPLASLCNPDAPADRACKSSAAGMSTNTAMKLTRPEVTPLHVGPLGNPALRYLANELRGTQLYNREQVIACSHEAAESIFEHLTACSALPPEFKGDFLMQSRLVAGMAKRIEDTFAGKASKDAATFAHTLSD